VMVMFDAGNGQTGHLDTYRSEGRYAWMTRAEANLSYGHARIRTRTLRRHA
jgi:hypothetical protein